MHNIKLIIIAIFFFTFSNVNVFGQWSNQEFENFKVRMIEAIESPKTTNELYRDILVVEPKNALLIGYMGTLEALKAKHTWNPYNKIKYVSRSLINMEKAIRLDPSNLEIRFMRFSIEHFTPAFLGFSKNLDEDRREIIKQIHKNNYGTANKELVQNIMKFLIESKRCTSEEILYLKSKI